jgi:hypothetical protein
MSEEKTIELLHQRDFETLCRAIMEGRAALIECQLVATAEPVAVMCVLNYHGHRPEDAVDFVPVAMFFNGNPYEQLIPPERLGAGCRRAFDLRSSTSKPTKLQIVAKQPNVKTADALKRRKPANGSKPDQRN